MNSLCSNCNHNESDHVAKGCGVVDCGCWGFKAVEPFQTKLNIEDERRNLWAQVIRGLFGVIRIMEHYVRGWSFGCPSDEVREAGQRLIALADEADRVGIADPQQPKYNFK